MPKRSHREAPRLHAARRAWQRYGIAVGQVELLRAERRIWAGRAVWLVDQPNMRSAYRVKIKGRPVVVVFDIHLDAIVTCLPNEMWARDYRREAA